MKLLGDDWGILLTKLGITVRVKMGSGSSGLFCSDLEFKRWQSSTRAACLSVHIDFCRPALFGLQLPAAMTRGCGLWLSARAASTVLILGGPSILSFGLKFREVCALNHPWHYLGRLLQNMMDLDLCVSGA